MTGNALPKINRARVQITYGTTAGLSSGTTIGPKKGEDDARRVILVGLRELTKLAVLGGFGDEALTAAADEKTGMDAILAQMAAGALP